MSSSSTSASSLIRKPKLFKVDLDGNVYCHHDIVVLRVVGRKSERHGQQFYACFHWPNMVLLEENGILKAKTCGTESKSKKPYVLTLLIAIEIWLYLSN
ncbi:hypothetical protein Hanom_Chr06g00543471 [Helianthus anomalus]